MPVLVVLAVYSLRALGCAHQGRAHQCWHPPPLMQRLAPSRPLAHAHGREGGGQSSIYAPSLSALTFCFCDEAVSMGSALVCVRRFWRMVGFSRDKLSLKCLTTWVCHLSVVKTFLAIATDSLLCLPQPKTRPDSPVPSLQGPCDRSLKSEVPCGSGLNWR